MIAVATSCKVIITRDKSYTTCVERPQNLIFSSQNYIFVQCKTSVSQSQAPYKFLLLEFNLSFFSLQKFTFHCTEEKTQ